MAYCVTLPEPEDGGPKLFGINDRVPSVVLIVRHEEHPPETPPQLFGPSPTYSVEMSKEYLCELLAYFDNPENRELHRLEVPPPIWTGQ